MRFHDVPEYFFEYALPEVVSVFYARYPNSFAKHIMSEDVLSRVITEDTIITRKLIVKKGSSFLKSVPKWLSGQANVRVMPVVEESVFDRRSQTLTTHTRNVACTNLMEMSERCVYRKADANKTALARTLSVDAHCRLSSLVEQFLMMTFRKSTGKTLKGYNEKLVERFGEKKSIPAASQILQSGEQKAAFFREELRKKKIGWTEKQ